MMIDDGKTALGGLEPDCGSAAFHWGTQNDLPYLDNDIGSNFEFSFLLESSI